MLPSQRTIVPTIPKHCNYHHRDVLPFCSLLLKLVRKCCLQPLLMLERLLSLEENKQVAHLTNLCCRLKKLSQTIPKRKTLEFQLAEYIKWGVFRRQRYLQSKDSIHYLQLGEPNKYRKLFFLMSLESMYKPKLSRLLFALWQGSNHFCRIHLLDLQFFLKRQLISRCLEMKKIDSQFQLQSSHILLVQQLMESQHCILMLIDDWCILELMGYCNSSQFQIILLLLSQSSQ